MVLENCRVLVGTGLYKVVVIGHSDRTWTLALMRQGSERLYELQTKRGELRRFRTLDGAAKVALSLVGEFSVVQYNQE